MHYYVQKTPFIDAISYTAFVVIGSFLYAVLSIFYFYFGKMFFGFYGKSEMILTENIYVLSVFISEGIVFFTGTMYAMMMVVMFSVEFPKSDFQLLEKVSHKLWFINSKASLKLF